MTLRQATPADLADILARPDVWTVQPGVWQITVPSGHTAQITLIPDPPALPSTPPTSRSAR